MNSEESRFRELLNEPPFDGSYRKEHCEQLRQHVLEAFDASQANPARPWVRQPFSNWRELMRRPVSRIAAIVLAAAIVCAAFGVLFRAQPPVAFASLIEPILNAKSARFNAVVEGQGLPKQTIRFLILEPGHVRQEMPLGQINIVDMHARKTMTLMPAQKSAMVFNMADMPKEQKHVDFFDQLRTNLRAADGDTASKREPLGKKQIDGRDAIGFRVTQSRADMTIWGDSHTGLPIIVEMKMAMMPEMSVTMTDFEFDVTLDEALFETQPPEGYSLQTLDVKTPTETDLIAVLRLLSDDNEGQFPDTFGNTANATFITHWVQKNPGKQDAAWTEKMMIHILSLTQGLTFAAMLPAESNARYAGKGIKRDDATSAVFWYKPTGASNYRVIHGDLSIKEQDAAPASPNAVPVTLGISIKDMTREMTNRLKVPPGLPAPKPEPPKSPDGVEVKREVPIEPKQRPDDPKARQIINRMTKTYAECKSYRDSGVVTTVFFEKSGERTVEKSFTTAFVRPDRFRFEYKEQKTGDQQSRYIVWSNGKEVQTWWDVKPGIEKPESLGRALAGATGLSGGSAATVAALLTGAGWGNITTIAGAKLLEDGKLDEVECYRVEGAFGNRPMTVWIDKTSYLVRRIDTHTEFDTFRTEQTTTYDPAVNEEIADNLLDFDPPVEN